MTDLELIFTMLGEAGTTGKAKEKDAFGFHENRDAAVEGSESAAAATVRRPERVIMGLESVSRNNSSWLAVAQSCQLTTNRARRGAKTGSRRFSRWLNAA